MPTIVYRRTCMKVTPCMAYQSLLAYSIWNQFIVAFNWFWLFQYSGHVEYEITEWHYFQPTPLNAANIKADILRFHALPRGIFIIIYFRLWGEINVSIHYNEQPHEINDTPWRPLGSNPCNSATAQNRCCTKSNISRPNVFFYCHPFPW